MDGQKHSGQDKPIPILIADDDEENLATLLYILEEEGYDITTAGTVAETLALINEHSYALVITDLMDKRSGDVVSGTLPILQCAAPTPVGVLTAWNIAPEEVTRRGFAFCLNKPYNLDTLRERVANTLGQPLSEQQERKVAEIQRFFTATSASDEDQLRQILTDDFMYIPSGQSDRMEEALPIRGRDAYIAFVKQSRDAYPEFAFTDIYCYALPERIAVRFTAQWRGSGGLPVSATGESVFAFRDERIRQIGTHFDHARLLRLRAGVASAPKGEPHVSS